MNHHTVVRECGHHRHVGTCPACQRAQLAKQRQQLDEATAMAKRAKS